MAAIRAFRMRVLFSFLLCTGLAGFAAPLSASATTGANVVLPPAHYLVPARLMDQYTGQYIMRAAAPQARLRSGAFWVAVNSWNNLYGIGQFYGWDARGLQTAWVATLYNFHLTKTGAMVIEIVGPTGTPKLGQMIVRRARNGDLTGQIHMAHQKSYAISFHKFAKS